VIRRVRDRAELDAALALREEVFCGEQGVPLEADLDGLDDDAIQIVAVAPGGEVVGTCRVVLEANAEARFGRLCVRRSARRRGIAAALLAAAEHEAIAAGARTLALHAQTDALELYRRAGYVASGEPFDEEGIEHLRMWRSLPGH
jgi:predicted GNAT family N-acyltransferase